MAERLFWHYTHGGIYPAFLSRNLFVEFGTFVSRVKLRVLEESPICQMTECPAIVITQKTQVNSELLLLCTGKNDKSELFYDTWNCLEATTPSSELSIFALYPKAITWNFTFYKWNHCLEVKIPSYHFLHYTENENSEFFQANQSF